MLTLGYYSVISFYLSVIQQISNIVYVFLSNIYSSHFDFHNFLVKETNTGAFFSFYYSWALMIFKKMTLFQPSLGSYFVLSFYARCSQVSQLLGNVTMPDIARFPNCQCKQGNLPRCSQFPRWPPTKWVWESDYARRRLVRANRHNTLSVWTK